MPNSHTNSILMRVQNETAAKIREVARIERRAANAQLAVIVDDWMRDRGIAVDVSRTVAKPARRDTPPRP